MPALRFLLACLLLATSLAIDVPSLAAEPAQPAHAATTIELFVREGCAHCAEAERFLARLAEERGELRVVVRDVQADPGAMARLRELVREHRGGALRVPATRVGNELILGYSAAAHTDRLILAALAGEAPAAGEAASGASCEAETALGCEAPPEQPFTLALLGRTITLDDVGLPAFTLAMGLLDGFNPCSMWVLILMISLLASLGDRRRMVAIAGTFVVVQGIAYFLFMTAWLNLFLFIGLSRVSQVAIAAIAILAGVINVKDAWRFRRGISLSIPERAKPGIYARMRSVVRAESLTAAIVGSVVLAWLVQIVEFLCTSGFPALFTRILTLRELEGARYYGYLLLYNAAYMLDDVIVLGIGIFTLSRRRLQEKEGRWLKLVSGLVMVGLGGYLLAFD